MGERLTLLLPRLGFGALVAAAFLVPIAYSPALAEPFGLPKAVVSWVAVLVAVAGVVAWSVSMRTWPVGRLRILPAGALLVGWTALATILSPEPLVSLMGQYGRYDGLAALLTGLGAAVALVAYTAGEPERLARIVQALIAGGAVGLVVVALDVVARGTGWTVPGQRLASVGLGGNSNFSGALLALVVPFVLGLRAHVTPTWARRTLVGAAVALAGGVLWTGTRGGIVALLAGVAVFGLLAPELLPKLVRGVAVAALVVGLALVAVSSFADQLPGRVGSDAPAVLETTSLRQRQQVWAGAARVVADHPVVGVGPDALALAFPYERSSRGDGRSLIDADEAHDVYLDRAATAGLPALAGYLWLIGTVGVVAWRGRRRVSPEHRWLLAAFGGALAGYLLQGVFSLDVVPLAFVSWLCVGALVSLTDPAARPADAHEEPDARPVPVVVLVGLLAAVLLGISLALRPLVADRHVRAGVDDAQAERYLEAYGQFADASSWLGHEPSYHQRQAAVLIQLAGAPSTDPELRRTLLDEALLAYDQALDLAPGDAILLQAQASAHLLAAQAASSDEVADDHIASALSLLRTLDDDVRADDALHLPLARALEVRADQGSGADAARDRDLAEREYQQARDYQPDAVPALKALARLAVHDGHLHAAKQLLAEAERRSPGDPELKAAADEVDRRLRDED